MSLAKSSFVVSSTVAYLAALPGNSDSEATPPSTPISAMTTGMAESALNVLALPSFLSTLAVPTL